MASVRDLACVVCGRVYAPGTAMTCAACGREGVLDVRYDPAAAFSAADLASRPRDHWRYRELLPIGDALPPGLQVGWTPVYDAPRLAADLDLARVWIKDDGRNPTGSFKDRASSVAVLHARSVGATLLAAASTGNAASSLAGFAAAMDMPAIIFVPERAPEPKVAQLLVFGAKVVRVRASYDDTWDLCQRACERFGWYNRNAAVNPYLIEGKKTAGLEIGEQLGERIPEWVAVSVGDGCTIAGVWKGLCEMRRLGFIPRLPRLLGVQAAGSPAVHDAFFAGERFTPGRDDTFADSIAVGHPRNWRKAVRAVRESGGTFVTVPDSAILEAMRQLGRRAAVFAEPAGAAALAGLAAARRAGVVTASDAALALVTGNGLKDVKGAIQAGGAPLTAEDTDLDRLADLLGLGGGVGHAVTS
ncbi:MAG: threonine synthase [Candidatus Sericytochromatia bacterium]|nr:threonine synthase [Candidatus Tanganyikabacteria bacterium]